MSKSYKLIEVSYEEHFALHNAGVWVQWDFKRRDGQRWYESYTEILSSCNSLGPPKDHTDSDYKYYTRIELEKSDEVQAS
jgi:hypothetical protein